MVDWDPLAEERVMDMYIIGTLNKLGDSSENDRITILLSQAIPYIREYGDERVADAKTIKIINFKKVYSAIIELTKSNQQKIMVNAVVALNNINFQNAPIGGDVSSILPSEKIKLNFSHLKSEMELYVKLSHGKIQLSDGVKTY